MMSSNPHTKVYFENLNSIRFIAALLVIIQHIEQFKNFFNIPNYWNNKIIDNIGGLGVILFFVLSGFLISFLLFKEYEVTNTISIKKFYIRRMLRIWPLYFLIIFLAFFVFPFLKFFSIPGIGGNVYFGLFLKLLFFIFFMPNLALSIFATIPYASQTWSIGAEEQFYLIWPILNKKIKSKWILMFSIILIYLIIKIILFSIPYVKYISVLKTFWMTTPIDCMAIGGIFALIAYENKPLINKFRKILFSKILQWGILLLLTIYLITISFSFKDELIIFNYELYSLLFGILIINFASNPNRIFSMEYKVFNYLGKISYGLYMYHPIIIVLSIKLCQLLNYQSNYILYSLVFVLIIALSSFSYEYFERIFINKKVKYSDIISGDNTK